MQATAIDNKRKVMKHSSFFISLIYLINVFLCFMDKEKRAIAEEASFGVSLGAT